MLGLLFVHAAHDGANVATDIGAFCFALAVFLGAVLLERLRSLAPAPLIRIRGDRGPPAQLESHVPQLTVAAAALPNLPLRR